MGKRDKILQKMTSQTEANIGVLRNFVKFTGKHLCQSLLKKRLCHRCCSLNFTKFLKTTFLQNTSKRLLLKQSQCYIKK